MLLTFSLTSEPALSQPGFPAWPWGGGRGETFSAWKDKRRKSKESASFYHIQHSEERKTWDCGVKLSTLSGSRSRVRSCRSGPAGLNPPSARINRWAESDSCGSSRLSSHRWTCLCLLVYPLRWRVWRRSLSSFKLGLPSFFHWSNRRSWRHENTPLAYLSCRTRHPSWSHPSVSSCHCSDRREGRQSLPVMEVQETKRKKLDPCRVFFNP